MKVTRRWFALFGELYFAPRVFCRRDMPDGWQPNTRIVYLAGLSL